MPTSPILLSFPLKYVYLNYNSQISSLLESFKYMQSLPAILSSSTILFKHESRKIINLLSCLYELDFVYFLIRSDEVSY